jgi:hypothetical protein
VVNKGSKDKKNYKSYYCPACKERIANDYHVSLEFILGFMIFGALFYVSKETITYFDLLPNMPFFIKFVPVFVFYFLLLALLYYSYLDLKCFQDKKDNSESLTDDKLIDGMLEFDDARITLIEKIAAKQTLLSSFYYFIITIIAILILYLLE